MQVRPLTAAVRAGAAVIIAFAAVMAVHLAQSQAGTGATPTAAPAAASASSHTVTLVTGEKVALTPSGPGRTVATLGVTPAGRVRHVQSLVAGDHRYVVPDEALPYLGHPLDLSLFDVATPVDSVAVTWAAGAAQHTIPGVSGTRVADPAALGAALAAGGALAGVASIRPAGLVPSPTPAFNLTTLVVRGLDRTGALASGGTVSVVNTDDAQRFVSLAALASGQVAFSVPEGHYTLTVAVSSPDAAGTATDALVVMPDVTAAAPSTVVTADARSATAHVAVPQTPTSAALEQMAVTTDRVSASGAQVSFTEGFIGGIPNVYVTPTAALAQGSLHWYSYFRLSGGGAVYDLEFPNDNAIPATFPTKVAATDLSTVDSSYHSDVDAHPIYTYRASLMPWETMSLRSVSAATAPLHRTEYVTGSTEVGWMDSMVWNVDEFNGIVQSPATLYTAGQPRTAVYLAAPLAPGVPEGTVRPQTCGACRQGDTLGLNLAPWTESGGHYLASLATSDSLTTSTAMTLSAGGTTLASQPLPAGTFTLPAGPADYTLKLDTSKSATWTTTAIKSSTTWTWSSTDRAGTLPATRTCPDGGQSCALEPLLFADYGPQVDLTNAVAAGGSTVAVRVHHQLYDPAPAANTLTFDVSTDDGTQWTAATVHPDGTGRFSVTLPAAPAGTTFLSFRLHAGDPLGDSLDQTIIHAVRVAG